MLERESSELEESVAAIKRGLDQADRGEGVTLEDFDHAFRARHQIPDDQMSATGFPQFSEVILTVDHPEHDLCAGDIGTVVDRHVVEGREDGYSIEFFDMTGATIAVITVPECELRRPSRNDRPAVRELSAT